MGRVFIDGKCGCCGVVFFDNFRFMVKFYINSIFFFLFLLGLNYERESEENYK